MLYSTMLQFYQNNFKQKKYRELLSDLIKNVCGIAWGVEAKLTLKHRLEIDHDTWH